MKTHPLAILLFSIAFLVAIFTALPVCAQEAPPAEKVEAPAEPATADEPKLDADTVEKMMQDLFSALQQKGSFWRNPGLFDLVFTLLTIIIGAIATKYGLDKKKWWKIIKAVEKAVQTVYVEFIRDLKLKNKESGGKLTADQMKEALQRAWDLAKDDLAQQGIDLAKWIAKEYFPVVVDKIIKTLKKS